MHASAAKGGTGQSLDLGIGQELLGSTPGPAPAPCPGRGKEIKMQAADQACLSPLPLTRGEDRGSAGARTLVGSFQIIWEGVKVDFRPGAEEASATPCPPPDFTGG